MAICFLLFEQVVLGEADEIHREYRWVNMSERITPGTSLQPSIALKEEFDSAENQLLVLTEDRVFAIPITECEAVSTCKDCLKMGDPHCGWYYLGHR